MSLKLIETEDIDFYYITSKKNLDIVCKVFLEQKVLAMDTETCIDENCKKPSALDPHSSKVSLVQVNFPNNTCPIIIDTLIIGVENCESLIKVFTSNKVIKIFHNASFDLKQIRRSFGVWMNNVKCTRVLMQSLGLCTGYKASTYRGHRLLDLSRDYFDINLDKTLGKSNWGLRPLTNEQLIYAALDVAAPKNSINKFTKGKLDSVVLRGYKLIKKQLELLEQQIPMEADQEGMYITAKLEYEGMHMDVEWLEAVHIYAENKMSEARSTLCKVLELPLGQDLVLNEQEVLVLKIIVPERTKTLLNSPTNLVNTINKYLKKHNQEELDNLAKEELVNFIDSIEQKDNTEEAEEDLETKYSQDLIKTLLVYKKFHKLCTECEKYKTIINPNTNRVHAGFTSVGASTGRMSSSGALNLQQVSNTIVDLQVSKNMFE